MTRFSVVIPVYNRPDEVKELLQSLTIQTNKNFEVIIVEDGSQEKCENIVKEYDKLLEIKYLYKDNSGPGQTRNFGAQHSGGDYIVFFDSDCIIPQNYFEIVNKKLAENYTNAYGGPDASHPSFTPVQKAISYSMTSFLTTGGIRGKNEKMGKFHPRSFNMGFSKKVFETTGGFSKMRFGEDIDMSLRIIENNFSTQLIKEAFVYHKRRTDFKKFFKQIFNSGSARINLSLMHPNTLKLVHLMPVVFFLGNTFLLLLAITFGIIYNNLIFSAVIISPLFIYILALFIHSSCQTNVKIGLLSVISAYVQLNSYALGFLWAFWKRIIKKENESNAFTKNFYK